MGRAIDMENNLHSLEVRVKKLEHLLEELAKPVPKPKVKVKKENVNGRKSTSKDKEVS